MPFDSLMQLADNVRQRRGEFTRWVFPENLKAGLKYREDVGPAKRRFGIDALSSGDERNYRNGGRLC